MSIAENHLILIDAARAMHERHRRLIVASCGAIAVEYESYNDSLGQTLECVTAFEFADGSVLRRQPHLSVWRDDAWFVIAPHRPIKPAA